MTLGPLSTVAEVVQADPTWAGRVRELVVMGGAVASHGNALPAGEANVAHDPTGASIVVGAAWTAPPLLVGLDITHEATFSDAEWEVLDRRANPAAEFLAEPLAFYRRFGSSLTPTGESPCHDLLAMMAPVMPDLIEAPVLPLAVVTDAGPAWGATIADRRVPYFARAGEGAEQELPDGFSPWRVGLGRRRGAVPGRGPRPVRRLSVSSSSLALAAAFGCAACYGVGSVLEQIGARREEAATTLDPRLLIRLAGQLPYLVGPGSRRPRVGPVARRAPHAARCSSCSRRSRPASR